MSRKKVALGRIELQDEVDLVREQDELQYDYFPDYRDLIDVPDIKWTSLEDRLEQKDEGRIYPVGAKVKRQDAAKVDITAWRRLNGRKPKK